MGLVVTPALKRAASSNSRIVFNFMDFLPVMYCCLNLNGNFYGCKLNCDNVFSQDKKSGKNKQKPDWQGTQAN